MVRDARGLVLFQAIVSCWMATSLLMVSALAWALFYPQAKRPGINLREL